MSEQQAPYTTVTVDEVIQASNAQFLTYLAWNSVGAEIEGQIFDEMHSPAGRADMQRALDLLTLADLPNGWEVTFYRSSGELEVAIYDGEFIDRFRGANAIAQAAEWVRAQKASKQ